MAVLTMRVARRCVGDAGRDLLSSLFNPWNLSVRPQKRFRHEFAMHLPTVQGLRSRRREARGVATERKSEPLSRFLFTGARNFQAAEVEVYQCVQSDP